MSTMFYSTTTLTLTIIITPTLLTTLKTTHNITKTTKLAFLTSLIPTCIFTNNGLQTTTLNATLMLHYFNIPISLQFDKYATLFLPIALFVTWSIMEFTEWYMKSDQNTNKFSLYLLLFLMAMTALTTANNLFQLFIGWEGVGIMSFMLIGWWWGRINATSAALQAVIYNRIGDIGLLLTLSWLAMNTNTWELQQMFMQENIPTLPLLGIILAATGKSAQFGLHPWLPTAMEGPTPVSALLHSSTMVVAGVFLLVRFNPLMHNNQNALALCLCLGAMTTLFAALSATTQNDIKKIIAFSTSSQLGLMVMTIGLNQPDLAFLHITTHAFFKAMLFLCSGSLIHNLQDEQDIRKMGGAQKTLPMTTTCMTLGNLALAGTPYLAGFYTKDTIIETMNTSHLNAWALITTLVATSLTAAYSLRMTFYVHLNTPRHNTLINISESNNKQLNPILRLAAGSITSGMILITINPPITNTMTMPSLTKTTTIIVTLLGLMFATDMMHQTTQPINPRTPLIHTTTTSLYFFNTLTHRTCPHNTTQMGQTLALQLNDLLWYEYLGPKMSKTIHRYLTRTLSTTQTGTIKTHLLAFTTLTLLNLTWALSTTR